MIEAKNASLDFRIHIPRGSRSRTASPGILQASSVGGIASRKGDYGIIRALDDVNFQLERGQRMAILGHNGSGKSTLLRVLAGVYSLTSGALTVEGKVQTMIDISLGLESDYTARENFELRRALLGIEMADVNAYRDEVFSIAGLGEYLDFPIRTYSTGMMLRLAFAMAYVSDADILLMDEWLSVGDAEFRALTTKLLHEKIRHARCVVMATHDEGLAKSVCSSFIRLEHGRVVDTGSW